MPEHHHDKVEHFVIHLIAVLFTLSTISATFLAYGVYEGSHLGYSNLVPQPKASYEYYYWSQGDWGGGTSSQTYVINWVTPGSWPYYSSASNVTASGNITSNASGGELVSSIFDAGTTYRTGAPGFSYSSGKDAPSVYVRGAGTEGGVNSATWQPDDSACIASYRYFQYKVVFPSDNSDIDDVIFWPMPVNIYGVITDANTSMRISGASVAANGITTTSALDRKTLIPQTHAAGGPADPGEYNLYWFYKTGDPTSYSITVSKTGYQSQTKTVTIDPSICDFLKGSVDFALSPNSSPSNPPTNSSPQKSTAAPTNTEMVSLSDFQKIKLPSVFTTAGSITTDLAKISDHKKIEGFTLDIPGKNKIVFKDALDLSAKTTADLLKELDKYVKMDQVGALELDSKTIPALNKKAILTMAGLKYVAAPEILIDGKKDTKGIISNIIYGNGVLTFSIAHFTKYETVPKFEILSPKSTSITDPNTTVRVRISDPEAVVTGEFNSVKLAKITPDSKTGEFSLEKLVFSQGENILKLEGQSKLGKVSPLTVTFTFGTQTVASTTAKTSFYKPLLVIMFVALAFAALLGYLVYRRRKLHAKVATHSASGQTQKASLVG